jgi:hypothetical protein
LSGDGGHSLCDLREADWRKLLEFCDRAQLTLAFAQKCGDYAPSWVERRLAKSLAQNAVRWDRIKLAFEECSSALMLAEIPYVLLKGFSHCPDFIADPRLRTQYDLDVLVLPQHVRQAYEAALSLGFEPLGGFERFPIDHLPTMIRKTGWEWRGDFFDTEIPISLELHFRLWDEQTEQFAPGGLEQFWERRQFRELEGVRFVALRREDMAGYSCLHILRHLLRGGLRPSHVYELALFLDQRYDDEAFWKSWETLHEPSLRRLEALIFGLACRWFNSRLPARIQDSLKSLPSEISRWLDLHGESPLIGLFHPNKDDLWLHWNLVDSSSARIRIVRRRILPQRLPGAVEGVHRRSEGTTRRAKLMAGWAYLQFLVCRAKYHLFAVPPTVWSAVRWWSTRPEFR